METKLITKTIKELADEYDGNVNQLHWVISRCNDRIMMLKVENEVLNFEIENQKYAREIAEKKSEVSTFVMIMCVIISAASVAFDMLFIW